MGCGLKLKVNLPKPSKCVLEWLPVYIEANISPLKTSFNHVCHNTTVRSLVNSHCSCSVICSILITSEAWPLVCQCLRVKLMFDPEKSPLVYVYDSDKASVILSQTVSVLRA
ncbi:hypothetical protein ILYODFUR_004287 [Ilyodon furcidens]|uniref:Uncharacterized protein n=1 Tax=Ilyodon furcidens TaxID=33524 RepID=A0ABV0U2L0_9TELE